MQLDRELSPDELRLLTWLLETAGNASALYLEQLAMARVVGGCDCGCPTIELGINGQPATRGASRIIADYLGLSPIGVLVGVSVHVREGLLSELEVWDLAGEENTLLPGIETLLQYTSTEAEQLAKTYKPTHLQPRPRHLKPD